MVECMVVQVGTVGEVGEVIQVGTVVIVWSV